MKKLALTSSLTLLLAAGCMVDRTYESSFAEEGTYELWSDDYGFFGNLEADNARLAGDIGPVRDLDEDARVSGWDDGTYSDLEVLVESDRGSAMKLLNFHGGIGHPALRPGTTMTFRGGDYPSSNGIYVEALGCSGPSPYEWDYDLPADEVEITVEEGPEEGSQTFVFTTITRNGYEFGAPSVATGSFVLYDQEEL